MKEEIINHLTEADLSSELLEICQIVGIEKMREIIKRFHGQSFYVPNIRSFKRPVYRFIKCYINDPPSVGDVQRCLCRTLEVTEKTLLKLLKDMKANGDISVMQARQLKI